MARALWKGHISFGLIEIPVSVEPLELSHGIKFHMLDKRNFAPIRYSRVNEATGEVVPFEEIVKGYEYEKGEFVVLGEEDFQRASPEAIHGVDVFQFVKSDLIDPMYYRTPYVLIPASKKSKSYSLFRVALEQTQMVALARVIIRKLEHIAVVRPYHQGLLLQILRYGHELRDIEDVENLPEVSFEKKFLRKDEVELAKELIRKMVGPFTPKKYKDNYHDALLEMIDKKINSGKIHQISSSRSASEKRSPNEATQNIMALLKQSLTDSHGHKNNRSKRKAA